MSSRNRSTSAASPAATATDGTQYSLAFNNKSNMNGSAFMFQTDPNITDPTVMSLAWFSEFVFPGTATVFTWTIDYSFVWADTGQLVPGVQFLASQVLPADLQSTNQVTLAQAHGAYHFTNQGQGAREGSLYITQDPSIPQGTNASVGIGMSGNGTFAVQAEQNVNLIFTPHPTYWIAFGTYSQGVVLNVTEITGAVEIDFPPGEYSMTATLGANNKITVSSTAEANAQLLAAPRQLAGRAADQPGGAQQRRQGFERQAL